MKSGVDSISKLLDIFLVNDGIFWLATRIKQWVGEGGDLDHFLILLEVKKYHLKPPISFNFNLEWIEVEGFKKMVKSLWIPYDPSILSSARIQFIKNLKRVKVISISWEIDKINIEDDSFA